MKNRLTVIISITVCILMVISVLSACSIKKTGDEDTSSSIPDDSWSGAEDSYEPVDITDVELVAIVSEALGDEATGFNGDLSSLTDEQLEKVKKVAEEKGYIINEENGGTEIKKNSNVQVSEVSDEKASEIYSKANIEKGTTVSDKQYKEISKAAEEKGATAITDEKGNVTIIETTVVPTTAKQTEAGTSSDTGKNTTTTAPYVPSTSPVGTTKNRGTATVPTNTGTMATSKKTTTGITLSSGNTFGGKVHALFSANAATSDGVVSVGNAKIGKDGNESSYYNGLIVKYDNSGKRLWYNILSGDELTKYNDVTVLTDGSIVAVGETLAKNLVKDSVYRCKGSVEGVISKYSSDGELLWTKIFGGSGGDIIYSVESTTDGGFVIGGSSTSTDFDLKNVNSKKTCGFVAKMDADGNKSWAKSLGGSLSCAVQDIATTSSGAIYAVIDSVCEDGDFKDLERSTDGSHYSVVFKITGGNIDWIKTFWESGNVVLNHITATNDNGCVLAGYYSSHKAVNEGSFKGIYNGGTTGTSDGMIVKMSSAGKVTWKLPVIGFESDYITGITPVSGGYAFTGYTTSTNRDFAFTNRGDYDSFVGVVSEYGQLSSITSFGGSEEDDAYSICSTGSSATSVYVSGATLSDDGSFESCSSKSNGSDYAAFAFKFDLTQQ